MITSAATNRLFVWSMMPLFLLAAERIVFAAGQQPPNIVMIIADDQRFSDFGFMGNPEVITPNLDALAAQSARFPHGYVPTSVCRPSLATLLTGLYPHQHQVYFNHPPPGFSGLARSPEINGEDFDARRAAATRYIRAVPTLPRLLAEHGYHCLQTGKFWEGHYRNAGFSEGMTTAQPSQSKYGNLQLASGDVVAHGNGDAGLAIGRETMEPIIDFLDAYSQQPFFIWYAPFLPHTPHDAPQRFFDLYGDRPKIPRYRLPYYASISQFDATVGELVKAIESRDLAPRTLFLFVSDNGWRPDEDRYNASRQEWDHTKASKRSPFEDGLRTPILLRWDGHIQPATHKGLVSSVDCVPSLLAAAGIGLPDHALPGRNLLPVASGQATLDPGRAVFGEIYPGDASDLGNPAGDIAYRWIRQGDWKLITVHRHQRDQAWNNYLSADALYNVVIDPQEEKNLIDRPQHSERVEALRARLNAWWDPRKP